MFAAAAVPALVFVLVIVFSKESPRWLMKRGREEEAAHVLASINGAPEAKVEAEAIRQSLSEEEGGIRELLTGPLRRALVVGFLLAALSQTSGITCLLSFCRKSSRVPAKAFRTLSFNRYWWVR